MEDAEIISFIEGNKLIAEFEQLGYSIDEFGNAIGRRGRKIKLHIGSCGYYQINTWKNYKQKTFLIHRLVASKYVPNRNNLPEVNHIDGNKLNNYYKNLQWCTRSENIRHGFDNGLITPPWQGITGKNHPKSKLYEGANNKNI